MPKDGRENAQSQRARAGVHDQGTHATDLRAVDRPAQRSQPPGRRTSRPRRKNESHSHGRRIIVLMASTSTDRSGWAEHARAVLDQAGHRKARARDVMIDLFAGQACALSPFEIEDRLRQAGRPVARASSYRILELLGERGLISRLELGDGATRYELIDPQGEHHHHLVCDSCGRLVPFDDGDLERAIDRLASRLDFRTDDHEVVLHGACSSCRH